MTGPAEGAVPAGSLTAEALREQYAHRSRLDAQQGARETALGGAPHMGNLPIAAFLLAHGARMDVFCAAATGKIEIVRAFLADDPKVIDLKGPHGIPLLRHAQMGKQEAVVALLRTLTPGPGEGSPQPRKVP